MVDMKDIIVNAVVFSVVSRLYRYISIGVIGLDNILQYLQKINKFSVSYSILVFNHTQ